MDGCPLDRDQGGGRCSGRHGIMNMVAGSTMTMGPVRPVARAKVVQLLGHRDVATTRIYTHVLNRGPAGVESPADRLLGG